MLKLIGRMEHHDRSSNPGSLTYMCMCVCDYDNFVILSMSKEILHKLKVVLYLFIYKKYKYLINLIIEVNGE
jgi:hypothetical protein